jgi:hypothetical protein
LGTPIAEFKVGKFRLFILLVLTAGALVVGLAAGAFWLWAILRAQNADDRIVFALVGVLAVVFFYAFHHRSKRRHSARTHLLAHLGHFLGFGALYLYSGAGGWRRARQLWGLRVVVFPTGIARIHAGTADLIRWDEIVTVRRAVLWEQDQDTVLDGGIRLWLETADGRDYEFDDVLSRLKQLRQLVEQHTLPHLLDEALDTVQAGGTVAFGVVTVSPRGLAYGGQYLPWVACEAVETAKGLLHVKEVGARRPFWRIHLPEVPNVHVLIALTELALRDSR